ncbi:ferritin-like domain-containing protein [Massilia arenosa]|uniref:Ferritin-like domain-containing protein n=1 Tax=Zemynaea arenosa TaxID=2561931 RepID=A0A4Y9S937_9BURK|nr:ferritin-like domain-containing protein [Massilia arenosa]TFW17940.1 ferritin-like domain-containing protein [Massilia arenosa]
MEQNTSHLTHGFDVAAIRAAAANMEEGPVTDSYAADREAVVQMLNDALATELVCVLRYKRHYYTISGLGTSEIKDEFLEHANEEMQHADRLAERIVQLNGTPNYNPAIIQQRSHAEYDDSLDPQAMVRANLIAERVAIESYRQMIQVIGDKDPVTTQLLTDVLKQEEEHADDMRDLLLPNNA